MRVVALLLEIVVLMGLYVALVTSAQLALADLGLGVKYPRIIALALYMVGFWVVAWLASHLIMFCPTL